MEKTIGVNTDRRDGRVELLRVFACLAVVALHSKPSTVIEGVPVFSRVLFSCFVSDAVAIFWLIAGFYIFRPRTYLKRIKSGFIKIALPVILYSLFIVLFPLFSGGTVSSESLGKFFMSFVKWEPLVGYTGHLWFLYVYMAIILLFPVLDAFRERCLSSSEGRKRFLLVALCLFAVNDLCFNRLLRVDLIPITAILPSCITVLAGYALYEERERFAESRKARIAGASVFVAVNILRSVLTYFLICEDTTLTHLYSWYSSFGFIASLSLCVFALGFKKRDGGWNRVAAVLGSFTMTTYLIHPFVISFGLRTIVSKAVCNGAETFDQYILFNICFEICMFAVGAAVSVVLNLVVRLIKAPFSLIAARKAKENELSEEKTAAR